MLFRSQTVASLPLVVNYKGQEYHATLTMPDGALLAGNNYTYTVKVRNKVLEVSEATIAHTDFPSARRREVSENDGWLQSLRHHGRI